MITTLLDYIKVYKDVLTSDECDRVVSHPENDKTWELSLPVWDRRRNYTTSNRRKCDYINISTGGKSYKDIDNMIKDSKVLQSFLETYYNTHTKTHPRLNRYKKYGCEYY